MRTLLFYASATLDGRLAPSRGAAEWLEAREHPVSGPYLKDVDAVLMGTAAFDFLLGHGVSCYPDVENHVFSHTVVRDDHPEVAVIDTDPIAYVRDLKAQEGGTLWLLGGGVVLRLLLAAGLVDEVVITIRPTLQGNGVPVLPESESSTALSLRAVTEHEGGVVTLEYAVA